MLRFKNFSDSFAFKGLRAVLCVLHKINNLDVLLFEQFVHEPLLNDSEGMVDFKIPLARLYNIPETAPSMVHFYLPHIR